MLLGPINLMLICYMLNQLIWCLLKTYNTESNNIIITFKDENGTQLELEEKVNLTSLINKCI